jgi:uncharacterized protein (TIGR03435 family)
MGMKISGTRITLDAWTVPEIAAEAYGLENFQLESKSLPDATRQALYMIEARASGQSEPAKEDIAKMMQTLLAERFHLKFHREQRTMPVLALVADKKGPALKGSTGKDECAGLIGPPHPDDRIYRYRFINCTLQPMVRALRGTISASRPIVDMTGLTGRYDIEIFATPEYKMKTASEPGDISFLDAVRKLGLRLEEQNAEVKMVVIDGVDASPTEN